MAIGGAEVKPIEITVKITEKGTVEYFDSLGKQLDITAKKADSFKTGFAPLDGILTKIKTPAGLASAAILGVGASLVALASKGSELDDLNVAFERLSSGAGILASSFKDQLDAAFLGTVDSATILRGANEALLSGIKPDQYIAAAKAATAYGNALGRDATQQLTIFTNALQTGNVIGLAKQGIDVAAIKNQIDLADALGKPLSVMEKQALIAQTLTENTQKLGEQSRDAGDNIKVIAVAFVDVVGAGATLIANLSGVNFILGKVADIAKTLKTDIEQIGEAFNGVSTRAQMLPLLRELNNLKSVVAEINEEMEGGGLLNGEGDTEGFSDIQARRAEAINKLAIAQKKYDDIAKKAREEIEAGTKAAADALKIETERIRVLKETEQRTADATERTKRMKEELGNLGRVLSDLTGQDGYPQLTKDLKELFDKQTIEEAFKYSEELKKIGEAFIKAGGSAEEFGRKVKEVQEKEFPAISNNANGSGENNEKLQQEMKKAGTESAETFGLAFSDKVGAVLLDGLNQALKQIFAGDDLNTEDYGRLFAAPLVNALVTELALAAGAPAGIAQGLGEISETLTNRLFEILGTDTPGNSARKQVDKFFAKAFDAEKLKLVIDGQLQEVSDLVFKGKSIFGNVDSFGLPGFDNALKSLPEASQRAFSGVGAAFENFLGVADDISGQIAAVFVNNIGGSLNNLQLLVQSSGVSFEQLGDAIVTAFDQGQLSFTEAATALAGIQQVAQDGIPDAIGAVGQAFDNLVAAGIKGGRVSVDALKDIGFEAIELGASTLEGAAQLLIASGRPAEEVARIFDAIKANGITSIEGLTSATTEQLIPVLAALENSGFDFSEQIDGVRALSEAIDSIPEEKQVDLFVNVKTNDQRTIDLLKGNNTTYNAGAPGLPAQ